MGGWEEECYGRVVIQDLFKSLSKIRTQFDKLFSTCEIGGGFYVAEWKVIHLEFPVI